MSRPISSIPSFHISFFILLSTFLIFSHHQQCHYISNNMNMNMNNAIPSSSLVTNNNSSENINITHSNTAIKDNTIPIEIEVTNFTELIKLIKENTLVFFNTSNRFIAVMRDVEESFRLSTITPVSVHMEIGTLNDIKEVLSSLLNNQTAKFNDNIYRPFVIGICILVLPLWLLFIFCNILVVIICCNKLGCATAGCCPCLMRTLTFKNTLFTRTGGFVVNTAVKRASRAFSSQIVSNIMPDGERDVSVIDEIAYQGIDDPNEDRL